MIAGIVFVVMGCIILCQEWFWKKNCAKECKDAYLKGFNEGVTTSKSFDVKSFIDSKYSHYKEKR